MFVILGLEAGGSTSERRGTSITRTCSGDGPTKSEPRTTLDLPARQTIAVASTPALSGCTPKRPSLCLSWAATGLNARHLAAEREKEEPGRERGRERETFRERMKERCTRSITLRFLTPRPNCRHVPFSEIHLATDEDQKETPTTLTLTHTESPVSGSK